MNGLKDFFLFILIAVGITLILTCLLVFGLNLGASTFIPWASIIFFLVCLFLTIG